MRRLLLSALAGLGVAAGAGYAQERVVPSIIPAGGPFRPARPASVPCPPGVAPYLPGVPSVPFDPSVPQMDPPSAPPGVQPVPQPGPGPMVPEPAVPNPLERRLVDPYAQATEAGGVAPRVFNENFDGDFGPLFYRQRITTGFTTVPRVVGFTQRVVGFTPTTTSATTQTTTTDNGTNVRTVTITNTTTNTTTNTPIIVNDPVVVQDRVAQTRIVRLALASRYSGVLVTDNDNPRPQDRFYGGFNFYDDFGGKLNPGLGQVDLQRQLVGFEKTFLGGDASFGMRLPFQQQYGPASVGSSQGIGDLSLLLKYAFVNDVQTGNVISTGLVLTLPTGSGDVILEDGTKAPHSVLFQPWLGFVRTADRAFVQGITSFVIPTDGRDPTLFNNSLGLGYYIHRGAPDAWLTSVAPVVEFHVRTPLSARNPAGLVYLQDQVNITGGFHFRFNRATLSTSMCVPVAGPRPWAFEAMSFFNYSF